MFRHDPTLPRWYIVLRHVSTVCIFLSIGGTAAVATAIFTAPSLHDAFPAISQCDDPRIETMYNGAVSSIRVEEREVEYFEHESRSVIALADHLDGVISLRPGHCGEETPDWVMAHELAHGLDFLHGFQLTDDANWVEHDIGHATEMHEGERELFAFCMTALVLPGHDAMCPDGNLQATVDVLRLHNLEHVIN